MFDSDLYYRAVRGIQNCFDGGRVGVRDVAGVGISASAPGFLEELRGGPVGARVAGGFRVFRRPKRGCARVVSVPPRYSGPVIQLWLELRSKTGLKFTRTTRGIRCKQLKKR